MRFVSWKHAHARRIACSVALWVLAAGSLAGTADALVGLGSGHLGPSGRGQTSGLASVLVQATDERDVPVEGQTVTLEVHDGQRVVQELTAVTDDDGAV